jgi:hypothetical protein
MFDAKNQRQWGAMCNIKQHSRHHVNMFGWCGRTTPMTFILTFLQDLTCTLLLGRFNVNYNIFKNVDFFLPNDNKM